MFRPNRLAVTLSVPALAVAATAAAWASSSFFLGAPAGVDVPVTHVPLPPVVWQPGQVIPPAVANTNGFVPGVVDLLDGEIVIRNERSMRFVWSRLFGVPYDASLFDFQSSFVVLVGGGAMDQSWFDISAVESVDATYAGGFPGSGTDVERFLSVTATTTFPGQPNPFPPPPSYRIDAVKVPLAAFDDVVFHRRVVALP